MLTTRRVLSGRPSLVSSAIGKDSFPPGNGHFDVIQENSEFCTGQTFQIQQAQDHVVVTGTLSGSVNNKCSIPYSLTFYEHSSAQLKFDITLNATEGSGYDRVFLTCSSPADEEVYGLGEQFSYFANKGEKVPLLTRLELFQEYEISMQFIELFLQGPMLVVRQLSYQIKKSLNDKKGARGW